MRRRRRRRFGEEKLEVREMSVSGERDYRRRDWTGWRRRCNADEHENGKVDE